MQGLRGKAQWWGLCVERWGIEDMAYGVKSLCNIGQKWTEKKRKEKNITCMPMNKALAVVVVGAKRRIQWWHGGLHAHRQGCVVIPLAYAVVVVPMQQQWVW